MPSPLSPRRIRAAGLVLALGLVAAGCDHVTDFDGPNLIDRFGEFTLLDPLEASQPTVDFAAGDVVAFTATFNKQVEWVLELTGQRSGAIKRIEGFSTEVTADNATWTGGTTELPLFKDELVDVALIIPSEAAADTSRTTVEVLTPKSYPGSVVAAFEGNDRITVGNFEFEFAPSSGISTEVPPGQGDGFYLLRGVDDVVRNFFVGLIDIRPPGVTGAGYFGVPTTVPEDLYFNMFLYSFNTPHTIIVVQLIADANGNGTFQDGQDTVFPYGDIVPDWEGWRAFSKPLSEIGLTATQASQIVAVRVLLISDSNSQPTPQIAAQYGIDYITFTAGGPLEL
ncbi:hypothetical protein [Rubrivirga sp. IMCC45206]|uniref:hypothetical protein n=1 Tax=Rubrivirga sp. IMCC45206 TaxID=3391614 RepID=UPI0039902D22